MLAPRKAPFLLLSVALSGCGGRGAALGPVDSSADSGPVESSPDPRRNVLVIDDGFDPTMPEFTGRVAAYYSIACEHSGRLAEVGDAATPLPVADAASFDTDAGTTGDGGLTLDQRKQLLLMSLQVRDTSCHLVPGVQPKPDPLASVARYRARWNDAIHAGVFATNVFTASELADIKQALDKLEMSRFHGTATAGLIAHSNPDVRLVLVEELLGTSSSIMDSFTCFEQQEVDANVALFSDPDVQKAYVDRPSSSLDDDFRDLQARHHIGVLNESFGTLSRQTLEDLQKTKGCTPVDLRQYFTVMTALDSMRAAAHPDPDALLVKSAGNDGEQIDSGADQSMCTTGGPPRLYVGAYDNRGAQAEFTNFGRCVDLYAPGVNIIAPIPGGWYLPLSGTSFSAPLTVRLISLDPQPEPFTTAAARDLVLSMRDSSQRIPLQRFPQDVLYDPKHEIAQYALTLVTPVVPEPRLINLRKLRALQDRLRLPGR
jgi:subtilisin family serine protease